MMALWLLVACPPENPPKESVEKESSHVDSPTPTDDSDSEVQESPVDSPEDSPEDSPVDSPEDSDPPPPVHPKVILFIGDGMGFRHVEAGSLYAYGGVGLTNMESLPYHGRITTASVSGVTDSAAAATTMATGQKTINGYLGMDVQAQVLQNIRELAASRGLSTGIVTTDSLTGATPAAFMAHVDSRGESEEIAAQIALDPPDVLLGGGKPVIEGALTGYVADYLYTQTDLLAWQYDGDPVVGLFGTATLPYVADAAVDVPSLAEMTRLALDHLSNDANGFFLMVEGARIDHASHANDELRVHPETAAFDEAIGEALTWAATQDDVTILVTADHECGGLSYTGSTAVDTTDFRWGLHSNADVPVYGYGTPAATVDGQRLQNTWIYSVLRAAVTNSAVQAPAQPLVVDGDTADLGAPITTQLWDSSYGLGYNQLDAMRVTATSEGLWVGLDGIYEVNRNTVLLLLDMDYGQGTGMGADTTLTDTTGLLDATISTVAVEAGLSGLGFDVVLGSMGAQEVFRENQGMDTAGLRAVTVDPTNFSWVPAITNFDDGNISNYAPATGAAAADAGATGTTAGGFEVELEWSYLYPAGIPATGASFALMAVLVNDDGTDISNQVLPPQAVEDAVADGTLSVDSVVVVEVDANGALVTSPVVEP
jgi:alkaline phosphatase